MSERLKRNLSKMTLAQRKRFFALKKAGELVEPRNDEHGFRITSDKQEKIDKRIDRELAEDRIKRAKMLSDKVK